MDKQFTDVLINWFPMLLLVGVWIVFMRKLKNKGNGSFERTDDMNQKILVQQTRIANTFEEIRDQLKKN